MDKEEESLCVSSAKLQLWGSGLVGVISEVGVSTWNYAGNAARAEGGRKDSWEGNGGEMDI